MQFVKTRLLLLNELLSYDFIGKEGNFSFHMIYYVCVYALPIQSHAYSQQAVVLNIYIYAESLNQEYTS